MKTVDLSLLVDGLRAEREQGITIDVAYRYFATPSRTFILADTPGHVQYTRNTVTGASTADLVVILTDARTGVVDQTRRHAAVAALLGVPHLLLAVNKIDLVDFDQQIFDAIATEFSAYAKELGIHEVTAIPISALHGDNVVTRSERIGWYTGHSVLEHLENVDLTDDSADGPLRFPVQYVIRPRSDDLPDYRGYAGRVAAGTVRPGDEIVALAVGTALDRHRHRHRRRRKGCRGRGGVGDAAAGRRRRPVPRRPDLRRRRMRRSRSPSSPRPSPSSPSARCGPAPGRCCATGPRPPGWSSPRSITCWRSTP